MSETATPKFTVFTPTFNRAHTLGRVHDSLKVQTFTDFEWLIVDDGSDDETTELVTGWTEASPFPIHYLRQTNQGKHMAFNLGVREARGELFLSLDSDDGCVPTALERFKHHWDAIPADERPGFSAVTALCLDQHGDLVGTAFPTSPLDSDALEIQYRHKLKGEKWGFHRTSVLREFPFPEMPGESFVSERLVWDRIAIRYRTRYVNEPLRIYHTGDGNPNLSGEDRQPARHADMYQLVWRAQLTEQLRWLRYAPLRFAIAAVQFSRFTLHRGVSLRRELRTLPGPSRVLCLITLPAALGLYARDQRRT